MSQAILERTETTKNQLGFWIYLMTDCVLFATLFATFMVLRGNTFDGPNGAELFNLSFVLLETFILLTSSFTSGLMMLSLRSGNLKMVKFWLVCTLTLGLGFLGLELYEFSLLAHEGNSWTRSGFLSAFFTLVGTHGLHIFAGLIWGCTLLVQLSCARFASTIPARLTLFSMFWHFLDIIWIFIFTIVYLLGAL